MGSSSATIVRTLASEDAPPDDRREAPRQPIELKVEYKRLNTFFADYTKNISKGGTFIKTNRPLPVGTAVDADLERDLGTRLNDWFAEHFRTKDARLHTILDGS